MGIGRRCGRQGDEAGFSLLEVVVSLLLLAVVSTSALSLFVRAMHSTDVAGQRQQAVEVANSQLETVRALPPHNLVKGRTQTEVDALWSTAGTSTITSQSVKYFDGTGSASASDNVVAIEQSESLNHVAYTVRTFVDKCYQNASSSACGSAVTTTWMIRVSVQVTWGLGAGQHCATADGTCSYVASTLIDPSADPTFNNS
jgi:prepilin-type N-terminal cleavage/methylation domain-containing protein